MKSEPIYTFEYIARTPTGEYLYTIEFSTHDQMLYLQLLNHHEDFKMGILRNYNSTIQKLRKIGVLSEDTRGIAESERTKYEVIQENRVLKNRIEDLEYELTCVDGLYASDQEDMSKPFKLNFKEVLKK